MGYGAAHPTRDPRVADGCPVIELRRAGQRRYERVREQEDWLTFYPRGFSDPLANGFGPVAAFREGRLAPHAAAHQPIADAEVLTYVRGGTLGYEDATGRTGILRAGEFQCLTGGAKVQYAESNLSPTQWAHIFQIQLRAPTGDSAPGYQQKRFSTAERRGVLCVVASPDGRSGSLCLQQDAVLYSALLDPGQHLVHPFGPGRGAWLHVVEGEIKVGSTTLLTGDGAGIVGEHAVSLTATDTSEVLLLDVDDSPATPRSEQTAASA